MEENQAHVTSEYVLMGAWDPWVQILVCLLAASVVVMAFLNYRGMRPVRRRMGLVALRSAGVILLLAIFFQPALLEERQARSRSQIAVIVDNSESMTLPYAGATRFEVARSFVDRNKARLDQLAKHHDIVFYEAGKELRHIANPLAEAKAWSRLEATSVESRLLSALEQLQAETVNRDLAGILLLSDGRDTEREGNILPADRQVVETLGAPIFAFGPLDDDAFRDVAVERLGSNAFGFYMNQTTIDAEIQVSGYPSGSLKVICRENGRVLGEKQVPLEVGQTSYDVSFDYVPAKLGKHVITLEVEPMDGEIYLPNNIRQTIVHIVRDKIRVLQIVGQPSWDERFLRQHLKSDPNIDLISFFILVNAQNFRPVPTRDTALIPFPAEELFEQELGSFDLVIFQNFNYGPFRTRQYLPRISEFVREGGGFVMIGGPRSFASGGYRGTSLAEVLPVELPTGSTGAFFADNRDPNLDTEAFRPSLTSVGKQHPITRLTREAKDNSTVWSKMELLEGFNRVNAVKADSLSLLEHPSKTLNGTQKVPVVSIRDVGKGRVMAVLTDSTWHWSFHAGNGGGNRDHYDEFWANAIRWLIRDPELELVRVEIQNDQLTRGESVEVRIEAFRTDYSPAENAPVKVELIRHSTTEGAKDSVAAVKTDGTLNPDGLLDIEIPIEQPGVYSIRATVEVETGRPHTGANMFVSNKVTREFESLRPNLTFLKTLSSVSKGATFSLLESNFALPLKPPKVIKVTSRHADELWTEPWIVLIAVILFGCEWYLRRKYGYV